MRRLNMPDGGMPFECDDLRWMQDGYLEAIIALSKGLGLSSPGLFFIIYGCEITDGGSTWDLSAGVCVFDGEVCQVAAQTLTKDTSKYFYLGKVEQNDSTGQEVFLDSSTNETYKNTVGVFTANTVIPLDTGTVLVNTAGVVVEKKDLRYLHMLYGKGEEYQIPLSSYSGNYDVAAIPFKVKKRGNMIEYGGSFANTTDTSVSTSQLMLTLPLGYRPPGPILIPIEGTSAVSYIEIRSNGEVYLRGDLGGAVGFTTTTGPHISGSYRHS